VYLRSAAGSGAAVVHAAGAEAVEAGRREAVAAAGAADSMGGLLMENVTRVDIEGDQIRVRSLFGAADVVRGRVASIDFEAARLVLESADA
jgi:predicted RNA-binding protein